MVKNVLVIGGHGMLGKQVVNRLVEEGFNVRALARDVEKVKGILPEAVEVVKGDLHDAASITAAAEGIEAVYLNLSTGDPSADFRPELDGTMNVIKALEGDKHILLLKISGLSAYNTEKKIWPDAEQKGQAEEAIVNSGHPYVIFRPTWFMESLLLMERNGKFTSIGSPAPLYWIAAEDYARMVTAALQKGIENKIYAVQGREAMTFLEAGKIFFSMHKPEVKYGSVPLWLFKFITRNKPGLRTVYYLMKFLQDYPEKLIAEDTWQELCEPELTIEEWAKQEKSKI